MGGNRVRYLVVFHRERDNTFSAFVPDVPTCVVTGDSEDQIRARIRDALYISTHSVAEPPHATAFAEEIDADDASAEVRALLD
jgi:predicted RNase H-like HicB family nuclease